MCAGAGGADLRAGRPPICFNVGEQETNSTLTVSSRYAHSRLTCFCRFFEAMAPFQESLCFKNKSYREAYKCEKTYGLIVSVL